MAETPKAKTSGPSKKLGPLKTWQWGLAGIGAYGVYYLYKAHQANTSGSTTATDTSTPAGTTDTSGGAGSGGSGVYYLSPSTSTTTSSSTTPGTMTMSSFAQQIAFQLNQANKGNAANLADVTKAVNQYLNSQPITNATLANQISNIVSYSNALGQQAINQGGLVKPVLFATNVVTSAHTPSEAAHRAAETVVEQAHVVTQPTRAATTVATTQPSRSTVKPKTAGEPYVPGFGVYKPGVGTVASEPYVPGFGVLKNSPAMPTAPKKQQQQGLIPAINFNGFGLDPFRDVGVAGKNVVLGTADVVKVGLQGVGKAVGGFFGGLF